MTQEMFWRFTAIISAVTPFLSTILASLCIKYRTILTYPRSVAQLRAVRPVWSVLHASSGKVAMTALRLLAFAALIRAVSPRSSPFNPAAIFKRFSSSTVQRKFTNQQADEPLRMAMHSSLST
eukprot:XP_001707028.1 Hypothetical protein GL50803_19280 [Giardia lamblia ATCC 50803]